MRQLDHAPIRVQDVGLPCTSENCGVDVWCNGGVTAAVGTGFYSAAGNCNRLACSSPPFEAMSVSSCLPLPPKKYLQSNRNVPVHGLLETLFSFHSLHELKSSTYSLLRHPHSCSHTGSGNGADHCPSVCTAPGKFMFEQSCVIVPLGLWSPAMDNQMYSWWGLTSSSLHKWGGGAGHNILLFDGCIPPDASCPRQLMYPISCVLSTSCTSGFDLCHWLATGQSTPNCPVVCIPVDFYLEV